MIGTKINRPPSTIRLRGQALYSIPDTARALSVGRTKVYELIAWGALESVRVGRRRLVPAHAIADLVERLCAGNDSANGTVMLPIDRSGR